MAPILMNKYEIKDIINKIMEPRLIAVIMVVELDGAKLHAKELQSIFS